MQRLLIAAALFAGACAPHTATPPSGAVAASDDDMVCQNELRTGSAIPRKVCRSRAEREQDKVFVQQLYLNPSSRPCNGSSEGGGVDPRARGHGPRPVGPGGCATAPAF